MKGNSEDKKIEELKKKYTKGKGKKDLLEGMVPTGEFFQRQAKEAGFKGYGRGEEVKKGETKPEKKEEKPEKKVKCPHCGGLIKAPSFFDRFLGRSIQCPHCRYWLKGYPPSSVYSCSHCGGPFKPGSKECSYCGSPISEPEVKGLRTQITGFYGKFLIFFSSIFVSLVWVFTPFLTLINTSLTPIIAVYAPNWLPLAYIGHFVIVLLGLFIVYYLSKMSFPTGILFCGIFIFVLGIGSSGILPMILNPGGILGEQLSTAWCMMTHPMDPMYCQAQVISEPEGKKIGKHDLDITLKKERIEGGVTNSIDLTITNPNPDHPANNVFVDYKTSYLSNKTGIFWLLKPSICSSEGEECTVGKIPLSLTLDTVDFNGNPKELNCMDRRLDLSVDVKYSYSSYGSGDFILFRSEDDYDPAQEPVPIKGPGPFDIIVYFHPWYYVVDEKRRDDARMRIVINNEGKGVARLKSIKINQEDTYKGLEKPNCVKWNQVIPIDEEYTFSTSPKIQKKTMFDCNITGLKNIQPLDDAYKGISFTVNLEYNYTQMISDKLNVDLAYCEFMV